MNPNAQNAVSSASGIFQYIDSTFASQSAKYGLTGDKNDPYIQIELTARILADGGLSHWAASSKCHQSKSS
jgi:muramidase (phage lysozyme)